MFSGSRGQLEEVRGDLHIIDTKLAVLDQHVRELILSYQELTERTKMVLESQQRFAEAWMTKLLQMKMVERNAHREAAATQRVPGMSIQEELAEAAEGDKWPPEGHSELVAKH